jgi:hypothetical protein
LFAAVLPAMETVEEDFTRGKTFGYQFQNPKSDHRTQSF